MPRRIQPSEFHVGTGQNAAMERAIGVSAPVAGSTSLYSSIVTTAPGGKTRIHHHGPCETSIYIQSGEARYTWGPTGLEHEMSAGAGDSSTSGRRDPRRGERLGNGALIVVLTRNCPDSHVVYVDGGPDGSDDVPAPC